MKIDFTTKSFNAIIPSILDYVATLNEGEYSLTIDKKTRPRSLRSNNYSWQLTDKLADVMLVQGLKLTKDEMHAEMIFRYGQPLIDESGAVIVSTASDVPTTEFCPYAKKIGEGTVKGKTFNHYKIYRGSHTYNSKEMSIFINGIVEECKEQGIETATPDEISRMISLMEEQ